MKSTSVRNFSAKKRINAKAIVISLIMLCCFTVLSHAEHIGLDNGTNEHLHCQLCQSNIDLPKVDVALVPPLQRISYRQITIKRVAVFSKQLQLIPPQRAPPSLFA